MTGAAQRLPLRYGFALLLSLAVHLGLAFALGDAQIADRRAPGTDAGRAAALTVYLRTASLPGTKPAAALASPAADRTPQAKAGPASSEAHAPQPTGAPASTHAPAPGADAALLAIPAASEPYYFLPGELNEKPRVRQDIDPDLLRVLPDVLPQPARARLLINERGEVDKVIVEEAFLSEPAQRFVIEALEKVRFYPGRLDNAAVKSQLPIEVRLERAASARGVRPESLF